MRACGAARTDVGRAREHNEDAHHADPAAGLFVVADGIGGFEAGEVASRIAVSTVQEFFARTRRDEESTWPFRAALARSMEASRAVAGIQLANLRIWESARSDPARRRMGTTIALLHLAGDGAHVGHVGDSRVYRYREGRLEQLTEDHSLLNDWKRIQALTPEEEARFPHKNVIVRALGMKDSVQVDLRTETPRVGDVYLLCTDGLTGMVDDATIALVLGAHGRNLDGACERLVELANDAGGTDNVTVALARIVG